MNLSLDSAGRQLIAAIRDRAAIAPASASGWDVFDLIGLTPVLTADGDSQPLGLLEWCLIFEELGALGRDLAQMRSVRTFLDVFVWESEGRDPGSSAEAFAGWVAARRSAGHATLSMRRSLPSSAGQEQAWHAAVSTAAAELSAEAPASRMSVDRDLLTCAAYAVGVGRRCLEIAQDRAGERVLGGKRLLEHQSTAHRLAEAAVCLALARVGIWRCAGGRDEPQLGDHRLLAAVADAVMAGLACSRAAVQMFGAAGTSDPVMTWPYHTAHGMTAVCGSPRALWESAGDRQGGAA